jgi:prepilin-type N-terminal cleavage/methylation domain-containing protein
MNRKAFTLIELLVVVAIIGILAAVGTVAYTGYTSGAKIAVTKTNHKTVVKFIKLQLHKCEIGMEVKLETLSGGTKTLDCEMLTGGPATYQKDFFDHFEAEGFVNPYKKENLVGSSCNNLDGCIQLDVKTSGSNGFIVKTYYTDSNNKSQVLEEIIVTD